MKRDLAIVSIPAFLAMLLTAAAFIVPQCMEEAGPRRTVAVGPVTIHCTARTPVSIIVEVSEPGKPTESVAYAVLGPLRGLSTLPLTGVPGATVTVRAAASADIQLAYTNGTTSFVSGVGRGMTAGSVGTARATFRGAVKETTAKIVGGRTAQVWITDPGFELTMEVQ